VRSDNSVGHIDEVKLYVESSPLSTGGFTIPVFPRPLSLAIPSLVGAMSTGDGFVHRWGRNGVFCVAVGPVTSTAVVLAHCMLA